MVSEIMLQQTQVDRVIPKYENFLKQFPTLVSLANVQQSEVLKAWQGLGYNRRGLNLKRAAEKIMRDFAGKIPSDREQIETLPGIGSYTSAAITTFAFNQAHIFIETNIRAVYIHEFFPERQSVHDTELLPLIEATVDKKNPREWYWALMDYGAHLKKVHPNPSRRSRHHTTQSAFEGSHRQVRGHILRLLTQQSPQATADLVTELPYDQPRIQKSLADLVHEGFIIQDRDTTRLA